MPLAAASLATCTAPARTSMRTVPPKTCLRAAGTRPGAPLALVRALLTCTADPACRGATLSLHVLAEARAPLGGNTR